jgi:hypothetical protein
VVGVEVPVGEVVAQAGDLLPRNVRLGPTVPVLLRRARQRADVTEHEDEATDSILTERGGRQVSVVLALGKTRNAFARTRRHVAVKST